MLITEINMKGRNPTAKEKRHMDKVSQIGCIVCRNQGNLFVPSEIHHTQGKTKVNAHFLVLPLCFSASPRRNNEWLVGE